MADPPAPFHPTATRRVRNHVRVGVGVIVKVPNTSKVWAGIRKGSHGAGSLALPGGHLELYESWEDCAKREVLEEMNLQLKSVQFSHVTNDTMESEEKHYVTIFMIAEQQDETTTPENMEPHKCEGWEAFSWSELKERAASDTGGLFGPLLHLVQEDPTSVQSFLEGK